MIATEVQRRDLCLGFFVEIAPFCDAVPWPLALLVRAGAVHFNQDVQISQRLECILNDFGQILGIAKLRSALDLLSELGVAGRALLGLADNLTLQLLRHAPLLGRRRGICVCERVGEVVSCTRLGRSTLFRARNGAYRGWGFRGLRFRVLGIRV